MTPEQFKEKYSQKTHLGYRLFVYFDDGYFMLNYVDKKIDGEFYLGMVPDVLEKLIEYRKNILEDHEKVLKHSGNPTKKQEPNNE